MKRIVKVDYGLAPPLPRAFNLTIQQSHASCLRGMALDPMCESFV
jgi:hypothetical protein